MSGPSLPTLLVFADDWGRHPSSCQHLIGQLLGRYQVYWVNTIGTRAPRLDLDTLRRGREKIRQWLRRGPKLSGGPKLWPGLPTGPLLPTEGLRIAGDGNTGSGRPSVEPGGPVRRPGHNTRSIEPHVLNPRMWPWFTAPLDRRINRALLVRQLGPLLRSLDRPAIALTTIPLVADLIGALPVERWVYYCVDDFGVWPGLDSRTLRRMEAELVRKADRIIAVSETLRERLRRMGREAPLLTHGVELDFWQKGSGHLPSLEGVERPLIVFWGVLDRRMDVEFVRRLAGDLERGTIVFAGPEADPEPALAGIPRTVRLGSLPFQQLPDLARAAAVLVMPYADLPVTRAMQPLKLKEYLATGCPVVVRDLPATREWGDCADVVTTAAAFSEAVRLRIQTGLPKAQRIARQRLVSEGWAEKARQLEQWALEPATHEDGTSVVAQSPDPGTGATPPVMARSPDRATGATGGLTRPVETSGLSEWHGQETVPQQEGQETVPQQEGQETVPQQGVPQQSVPQHTDQKGKVPKETVVLETRVVRGSGGGPDKTILNTPRFLTARGYRTICAYMHPPNDPGFEQLRAKARKWGAPLLSVLDRGFWDLGIIPEMLAICRRERVGIWHGHDYKSNALGLLLRRFWPMKLITTVHGWVHQTRRTPLYYWIDRLCLPRYDLVICVSQDLYERSLECGVAAERCVLIENAIDTEEFCPGTERAECKRRLGIPVERFLIGSVGRLSAEKGFDLLIRAVDRLLSEGRDVSLVLVGEGEEEERLRNLSAELGRSDRIQLLGYRADVPDIYQALDVFALSSHREGLPNVLLEAMAFEVPVVATRIAGIPKLIRDGDNGLLVQPGDLDALSGALSQLYFDGLLRTRLGGSARRTIEARYSFSERMARVAELYDRL